MSKRGHNEGSIYKRLDGRWAATITLGAEGGRGVTGENGANGEKRKRKTYNE